MVLKWNRIPDKHCPATYGNFICGEDDSLKKKKFSLTNVVGNNT